jgi:uncharacterized protein YidB (DUF937 family)
MAISPLTLGLLALLAYRTYQGKGRLADMLGQGATPAAEKPVENNRSPGAQGGGISDILGSIFGGSAGAGRNLAPAGQPGGLGDLLSGGLGRLLAGGAAGGLLSGGLGGLVRQFEQAGLGETAHSWVGRGQNRPLSPHELENAVGKDTLQRLSDESGRPYNDVLSELSTSLPENVDQLTPEGRIPSEEEIARGRVA